MAVRKLFQESKWASKGNTKVVWDAVVWWTGGYFEHSGLWCGKQHYPSRTSFKDMALAPIHTQSSIKLRCSVKTRSRFTREKVLVELQRINLRLAAHCLRVTDVSEGHLAQHNHYAVLAFAWKHPWDYPLFLIPLALFFSLALFLGYWSWSFWFIEHH